MTDNAIDIKAIMADILEAESKAVASIPYTSDFDKPSV